MKVLLIGGSGLIGAALADALRAAGDEVLAPRRSDGADLADPRTDWSRHLAGVDAVVNAAGVFGADAEGFDAVHAQGPARLFEACVAAGVARVVQVSALGADADAPSAFLRSKHAADQRLLALPLDATVVQPSLVFAPQGASAGLFLRLAALPLVPLPGGGAQRLQPVHLDDVVQALLRLLHEPGRRWSRRRVALVGMRSLTLAQYLRALRAELGIPGWPAMVVPRRLVAFVARLGARWPGAWLTPESWAMLERGNTAAAHDITALLGRAPRPVEEWLPRGCIAALRMQAQLGWLLPLLRGALAAVWIWTAIVSLWLFPRGDSLALLARAGVPEPLALPALWAAGGLDLLLGVLTLAPLAARARRRLWAAQALLIAGYTLVITLRLPEWWLHPYAPIAKNLPLLALLALLAAFDREAPRPR